jgi:hypothetical protein
MYGVGVFVALVLSTAALATGARAATAEPAGACAGLQPAPGAVLHGPILEIPDASSLCVALGDSPGQWVSVRLPALGVTRSALMAAAFGRNATCVVGRDLRADCVIEGRPLKDQLLRPEVLREAAAWR